jgi:hypothetical protein
VADSGATIRRTRRVVALAAALGFAAACVGDRSPITEVEPQRSRPVEPFLLRYAGTTEVDGELTRARPGALFATELRAVASGSATLLLEQKIWFDGRDAPPTLEATLVAGERVWQRGNADRPWILLSGFAASDAREFAELVWRAPAPIAGGTGDSDIERRRWRPHPRLGDVLETVHFRHVSAEQGRPVAHELTFERFGATTSQKCELKLVESARSPELTRELAAPAEFRGTDAGPPRVDLLIVAPRVVAAVESESGVRALVVVFERELVVVEAPLSSAAGERIVAVLAEAFPKLPIGHVVVTDASPRLSGGLRAFLAAGATIVTTPELAAGVEATVTRPFTLEPDRLAHRGGALRIETFSEGRRFSDMRNEMQALRVARAPESGGDSVVFWLPRARLLYGAGLGFTCAPDGTLVGRPDGRALLDFVRAQKLDVARLLEAQPENGDTGPVAFDDWVRCLPQLER